MLIIGAILIVPAFISTDAVRSQILARVEQATGRQARIDGPISISLIPTVHVSVSGIGLGGVTGGDALKVGSLSLGVRLWPLLSGQVAVSSVTIAKPEIVYTIDKNGRSNWQEAAAPATSAGAAKPKSMEDLIASSEPAQPAVTQETLATLDRIGIGELTISDGTLTYRDERSGAEQMLTAMNLTLKAPDLRRGASLDGSFNWRGKSEKIALALGARPDVNKLAALPVDLKLSDDVATVAAKGTALVGDTNFSGTISANGGSLAALAGRFGTVLPPAPAYGKFAVSATVAATSSKVTVDKFAATLGDVQLGGRAAITEGKTTAVAISTQSKAVAFDFNGEAGAGGLVKGNVSLSTTSLRNLLRWIGQPIGDGGGLQNFSIKGAIALDKKAFKFDRATFTLDTSSGLGSGAVTFGGRLGLSAGLAMKMLDVTPYLVASGATGGRPGAGGGGGSASGGNTGGGAWSTQPIAFAGLKAIDASLNLKADQIVANKIKIGATSLTATLADGKLSAKLADMSLYQGKGSGALTVDGAAATPAIAASFDLAGVSAQPFLTDALGYDRLSGTGAFSFDLAATGTSQSALMHSLRGKGATEFRDGSIRGFNLASLKGLSLQSVLGGQLGSSDRTDFSRLAGTYTISSGVLTNNDLTLIGPLMRATGAGTVDIGNRTIAYRLEPKIVGSLQGQGGSADAKGLTLPFRVEGSWDDPRYVPEFGDLLANPNQTLDQLKNVGGGLLNSIFGKDKKSNGAQPAPQQPAAPNGQPAPANPPAATGQQPTPPTADQPAQQPANPLQKLLPQLLQQNGQ